MGLLKTGEDLYTCINVWVRANKQVGARLFSVVSRERTGGKGHMFKYRKFH